jgi:hypothetical protein
MNLQPSVGSQLLDLESVIELIQLERVDAGLEAARLRHNPKRLGTADRRVANAKTPPNRAVRDLLEAPTGLPGEIPQPLGEILIQGEGGSHEDIMMLVVTDVKMSESSIAEHC